MTHLHAGMTGTTRDGSRFEIFAERDGILYGRLRPFDDGFWYTASWNGGGMCWGGIHGSNIKYDILPPAPVKKWRWVIKNAFGHLHETQGHFSSAEDAVGEPNRIPSKQGLNPGPFWKAIAKIEGSEICE